MQRGMPIVVLALMAPLAAAQDIYKCVDPDGVTYQSEPCAAGQAETRVAVGPMTSRVERVTPMPTVPPSSIAPRSPAPWRNRTLVLGMSDDEVLNMPAWGRPARIERTRMSRGWLEEWTYGSPAAGGRRLRFVNARLVGVDDAPAQVAQLTPR